MMAFSSILNSASVGLFGAFLSVSFCDIQWSRRNKIIYMGILVALGILQAGLAGIFEYSVMKKIYPLVTHLPLIFILTYLTQKCLWSVAAVLTAYLCCQLRRWLALLVVVVFSGGGFMQDMTEVLLTVPLFLFLVRYIAPAMRRIACYSLAMQMQFSLIPFVFYMFDYVTRVYTDWLLRGSIIVVEFMPFVCSAAYLVFVTFSTREMQKRNELENIQKILDLQIKQYTREMEGMKKSQQQMITYRHDLRHHLYYLSNCIEHHELERAQNYIQSLDEEITNQTVVQYCENIAVNLIISNYAGRAKEAGIEFKSCIQLRNVLHISDMDLCVLLSNAVENALHSGMLLKADGKEALIEVRGYEKGNNIFLEIVNSCDEFVVLENGIPVTKRTGHGIGVKSICAIVEKYGGIYHYEVKNGCFVLRLSI